MISRPRVARVRRRGFGADRDDPGRPDHAGEEPSVSLDDIEVHSETEQGFIEGLFNDPETVGGVDGIDLDIPESNVVALVGESVCGKSTLGKTAIAAQRPTGGSVKYRGHDVRAAKDGDADIPFGEVRQALQIVHQDPGSAPNSNRTVMKTLAASLKRWQPETGNEDRRARVPRMLERVGTKPATDYAGAVPSPVVGR